MSMKDIEFNHNNSADKTKIKDNEQINSNGLIKSNDSFTKNLYNKSNIQVHQSYNDEDHSINVQKPKVL